MRWQQSDSSAETTASAFLHENYKGGKILAQFFGSESLLFDARISLGVNIYEGSYQEWLPALAHPLANHIKWIVLRTQDPSDQVAEALEHSPALGAYRLEYGNTRYRIYEHTTQPPGPSRTGRETDAPGRGLAALQATSSTSILAVVESETTMSMLSDVPPRRERS